LTGGATARLFAAIDLPAAVRGRLTAWARGAAAQARKTGGQLRLVEPELLHLTLCFLGSRPVEELQALGEAVGACAQPVGKLALGAPVWLPPRRPRTLAVEVHDDPDGTLRALRDDVARALADVCDFEPERRRFRPHVTVARMGVGGAPRERGLAATPSLSFEPQALALYRSWLSPSGASYEAVARHSLSAS
jgi:RNA 2',3'-cyclic 3'-phosphodiesterase